MIREIGLELVLPIRREVMWPDESIDFIRIVGDEKAVHFGYFVDHEIVGVVSVFKHNNSFQFRKLAVMMAYQGKGVGTKLVEYVKIYCESLGGENLWCNARLEKIGYYEKMKFIPSGEIFNRKKRSYRIMVYGLTNLI
jgi:N-acetylglutamate synthase-like GNAT family acetyltransferase